MQCTTLIWPLLPDATKKLNIETSNSEISVSTIKLYYFVKNQRPLSPNGYAQKLPARHRSLQKHVLF